jgi:hypothetical protein
MAKKPKTLETKLRSAIRLIWSRSVERRAILKAATIDDPENGKGFNCPICGRDWPIQMAEVDHEPPLGTLTDYMLVGSFIHRMFFGPQRAVCKICHKKKTAEQRRKK